MHDSLLYRFRGALLGAWLGEGIDRFSLNPEGLADPSRSVEGDQPAIPQLIDSLLHQAIRLYQIEFSVNQPYALEADADPIANIVLTLPIALFYHDQPQTLQEAIQQRFPATQQPASAWAIVLGQTLSLLLRERLQPETWLEPMLHWVDELADPLLIAQLQQVQHWLKQPTSLGTFAQWAQNQPTGNPLALPILQALYSFLSTPDSFRLTLRRLQQLPTFTPTSGLIAGLLSGAYNGVTGIPQVWRQQSGASLDNFFRLEPAFSKNQLTEPDLFYIADRLLATWAGIDQGTDWQPQQLHHHLHRQIITAPRVIRFR